MSRSEPGVSAKDTIRLQVFLARCGLGSRRGCETLIHHGRVAVNGAPVTQLGTKVSPGDSVTLDGKVVVPSAKRTYIAVHKPREYLCANSDPQGRPLVSQLFSSAIRARLFHVGRLDFLSTGLILYTNDGEFSKLVSHPRAGIEKEYLVETGRVIDDEFLHQYSRGHPRRVTSSTAARATSFAGPIPRSSPSRRERTGSSGTSSPAATSG